MSVPVPKRGLSRLEVNIKALELCEYTLKITSNENKFSIDQKSFVDKIRDAAIEIHLLCREANEIRVDGDEDLYNKRITLQCKAIDECIRLTSLIEISKKLFHMDTRRVVYWMDKTLEVKKLIQSWLKSDRERLRP